MKIKENIFGGHDILNDNGWQVGRTYRIGNRYDVKKDGMHQGYIMQGPNGNGREYRAYNQMGQEIGKGLFEAVLSLFF